MNDSYKQLFYEVCRNAQILAEQVADYNNTTKDDKGKATALSMRDDYMKLMDKVEENAQPFSRQECAQLLVAAMIVSNNFNDRIEAMKKAITGYKTLIIPKLQRVMDETTSDEAANELFQELFQNIEN